MLQFPKYISLYSANRKTLRAILLVHHNAFNIHNLVFNGSTNTSIAVSYRERRVWVPYRERLGSL
jgi:hypothetical protein